MVKVSISLPNSAHITVESDEPGVILEILGMALRDLPKDLMQAASPVNGGMVGMPPTEKGSNVSEASSAEPESDTPSPPDAAVSSQADDGNPSPQRADAEQTESKGPSPREQAQESFTSGRMKAQQAARSAAAELAFIQFCQSINPLGDMRKVVVATEGASRFLDMDSVDAEDLGNLFDRVGWLHPHSFTQTLRNAARSKFRWLERVPGRAGRYTGTDLGRTTTVNDLS